MGIWPVLAHPRGPVRKGECAGHSKRPMVSGDDSQLWYDTRVLGTFPQGFVQSLREQKNKGVHDMMARHHIWRGAGTCIALAAVFSLIAPTGAGAQESGGTPPHWLVYIGTYTGGQSEGIYLLHLDTETGELEVVGLAGEANNPSFLALHPTEPLLYSVGRMTDEEGNTVGALNAFAIDPESGLLELLNQHPSIGGGPCHIAVDLPGRHAMAANYGGGSAIVASIEDDGSLGETTAYVEHEGSSVHPRQQSPHAHAVDLAPDGRFLFVADLGIDQIRIYRYSDEDGSLEPNDPPHAETAPGAGPRHFTFHPSGEYAYVINELDNTITAFTYDAEAGALDPIHTVPTLPDDFDGDNTTAEIRVHPSGRFVYGSNRGHHSIAAFSVDADTGELTPIGHTSTRGETPRNFNIDPTGRFLLAANQDTDNIAVFRIDQETGELEFTGSEVEVGAPVCVTFRAPFN